MSNAKRLQRKQKCFIVIQIEGMVKVTFIVQYTFQHNQNNTSVYVTANVMTVVLQIPSSP